MSKGFCQDFFVDKKCFGFIIETNHRFCTTFFARSVYGRYSRSVLLTLTPNNITYVFTLVKIISKYYPCKMNMSLHVINSLFRCFPRAIMVQAMSTRFVPSCQVFNSIVSFHSIRKDFLTKPLLPSQCRHYAKGKDKKKDKLKGKVQINDVQIAEVTNVQALKDQMQETVEGLKDNFIKHLSLRSSSGAIEALKVDLDGKEHTIQELAQVVRKNPKTIVINMAIFPQAVPAVTKALRESGMNLNPQQDGTTLYVPVPK